MYKAKAYSAASATSQLASTQIPRRDAAERDVQIEILFCGICHTDLHTVRDEFHSIMPTVYPCVPGHEIVGRVTQVGSAVTKFKTGDLVGVGCLVDSDHTCPNCQDDLEQFCPNQTLTFNSPDKHLGGVTYGGYSESIIVDEHFVLRVPANLNLAGVAPLLCAGITTYSPIRRWGDLKGKKVGVAGLGGLGHKGVKFARAFGARVVVFTTSPGKKEDALRLGADEAIISTNAEEMQQHAGSFDFILDTIAADHDINAYINLLNRDGNITRDSECRVVRDGTVVHTGKIGSLKRFKDDVTEVRNGMECGITLASFHDTKSGDIIEAFVTERVATEVFA